MMNTKEKLVEEYPEGTCEHCHKEQGDYCINPYLQDMYGDEEWQYICTDCYNMLIQEV
jgi:hypothetical protein